MRKTAKNTPKTAVSKARPTAGGRKSKSGAKKTAQPAPKPEARTRTKKAVVLELLRRKQGATTADIAKATGWQNHSIRAFISAHVAKKMGLAVELAKNDAGKRIYRIGA